MSSLWGNPVWNLFHTFAEKVNDDWYRRNYYMCFDMFKKICHYLPCPVCTMHAKRYLQRIKSHNVNTKAKLQNMFFHFHNSVNARTGKSPFKAENLVIYQKKHLGIILHNFVQTYAKNYNTQLLAGRMPSRNKRRDIANSILKWFRQFWREFNH